MDRRKFIKIGTGAVAVGAMSGSVVLRAAEISAENKASDDLTAGYSAASDSASEYSTARYSSETRGSRQERSSREIFGDRERRIGTAWTREAS